MKKYTQYLISTLFVVLHVCVSGCVSTKYVPDGEYLLNKVTLTYSDKKSKIPSLTKQVRQRPNTKVLGLFRVQLGFYNMSGRKDSKFNNWLKRMGEEPVIYTPYLTDRSVLCLQNYLRSKGYYEASISDTVSFKKKKAHVTYNIVPGRRTFIYQLDFKDKNSVALGSVSATNQMTKLRLSDTSKTLLKVGAPLDLDVLEAERTRVSNFYRENGYYAFAPAYVRYFADTAINHSPTEADLITSVVIPQADSLATNVYKIGNVLVNMDFNQFLFLKGEDTIRYNTREYEGVAFKYSGEMNIKYKVILQCLQFKTGDIYNTKFVTTTYSRLQSLNLYKYVNIVFKERADTIGVLDCEIQLTPMKRQSYNAFIEGTNNSGNIGVGGNLTYNHRNLFKGAEDFTVKVWGALKKERMKENTFFSTTELGVEVKLETPQFWMPFLNLKDFRKNSAPHTATTFSFSREHTPYYNRSVSTIKYGYWWKKNPGWRFDVNLADVNYVKMSRMDSSFFSSLKNKYILSSYTSHVVMSGNFAATYSDVKVDKDVNYNWFRVNFEGSGNLMSGLDAIFNAKKQVDTAGRYYTVFGVRYAQYVKSDFDYRFHQALNPYNAFVYRFFIGAGVPYGNMKALPFEEAYFCGGANDMRGWHSRMLGPGSYKNDGRYPNSVGDFKLEVNWEYRFKLFWLLEGALFADAGNVWKLNHTENLSGSVLNKNFYKDIAVDCGPGLRLDVNFFLIRVDWGIRMRDPAKDPGKRFVLINNGSWMRNTILNIAIGYPF